MGWHNISILSRATALMIHYGFHDLFRVYQYKYSIILQ